MQTIEPDLDIYELAYLADGKSRVAHTVIVSLVEKEFLLWDVIQKKLLRTEKPIYSRATAYKFYRLNKTFSLKRSSNPAIKRFLLMLNLDTSFLSRLRLI